MADTSTPAPRAVRADAARSRVALLASAATFVARDGAGASLEAIARDAGVGSATLHRHFPTRWDLLEAIFHDRAERIAGRADELRESGGGGSFAAWFGELVEMATETAGLAAVVEPAAERVGVEGPGADHADRTESAADPALASRTPDPSCHATIARAGGRLLAREKAEGGIRDDLRIEELMTMAMAISTLPTAAARRRLLEVTASGWAPERIRG